MITPRTGTALGLTPRKAAGYDRAVFHFGEARDVDSARFIEDLG
jgi:hypothetical protein